MRTTQDTSHLKRASDGIGLKLLNGGTERGLGDSRTKRTTLVVQNDSECNRLAVLMNAEMREEMECLKLIQEIDRDLAELQRLLRSNET